MIDLPLDQVIEGDCRTVLADLPAASVDLVFADPPYNLQLTGELRRPNQSRVNGVDAAWDKLGGFEEYDTFCRAWLGECRRVMRPDATIWVIGTYHNIFRLGALLQDLGFWILNDVIWRKTNPMPNFRGRRFANAHETLIWAARDRGSRHVFNHHAMKALNDDLQMRSDWLIPLCTGPERLKRDGAKLHPTQKPEALLHNVLLASSRPGQTVLDPFLGTGTTAVVAKRLGRRFIGIESDRDYAAAARARIEATAPDRPESLMTLRSAAEEPRVAFGALVAAGWIRPGEVLTDARRRHHALVRVDASLQCDGLIGSIHRLGALLQDLPACNGWRFWHLDRPDGLIEIDQLRTRFRESLTDAAPTPNPVPKDQRDLEPGLTD